jgi:hypothetical protein
VLGKLLVAVALLASPNAIMGAAAGLLTDQGKTTGPAEQGLLLRVAQHEPLATLRAVYATLDKPREEPFSKRLMALRTAAIKRSQELNEPVPGIDFDYAIDGQDHEPGTPASVRYQVLRQDARSASVRVTFQNGGPRDLRYDLILEDGQWRIDEVRSVGRDPWVLSELLREGAGLTGK